MLPDLNKTVSDIVREDYRTADVFKKYGINYCCSGQAALIEACALKDIDYNEVVNDLRKATRTICLPSNLLFDNWKIDFLIDYIVNVHHAYLSQVLPEMEVNLISFVNSHTKQYPELERVLKIFQLIVDSLTLHNRHEEEIIFPYIKQMENMHRRKETYGSLFVRTLRKPLNNIEEEHKKITELLLELRTLTNNYTFPPNACTNHQVVFKKLKEFDDDMIQHKHLENNILFPKAIEMEKELLQF